MTGRGSAPQAKRITGLFTELLGVGGIQEAGRLTAAALNEIALRHGWPTNFQSLNDPRGPHEIDVDEHRLLLCGFRRAKVHFVLSAISHAGPFRSDSRGVVLAAHPHLAVPAGWIRGFASGLKTIVMAHGVEVWKPLPLFRRRALAHADLVLAPSRDTAQKLIAIQGVSPEKVRTLSWPISSSFLRLASAHGSFPLPAAFPRGRVILTVGRWAASERYKGADELIRAIPHVRAAVPHLHLVAVGGGDDLPRLQKLAADLGVADCVHFLENLSREEIAACYARADIFALPSTGEGFGLVFLEAMAFSKAIVAAACGGTTDVVEDGVNGLLVPPGDAGRLGQALDRLLGDDSLRAALGHRGAEIVRQKFRFDLFQTRLEQILDDCGLREQTSA